MNINTADIIAVVSERLQCNNELATEIVEATFKSMGGAIAKGERIYLRGIGTWIPYTAPAHKQLVRVSKDGVMSDEFTSEIIAPPKKKVKFRVGKEVKEIMETGKQ